MRRILSILSIMLILCMLNIGTISAKAVGFETIDVTTFGSDYRITSIHIGADVGYITENAFKNLNNLRSITVSNNNLFYSSYSDCLYDKDLTELLCFPAALSGAMIPSTAVSIGPNALKGVPEGLKDQVRTVIELQAQGDLGEYEIPGAHFVHYGNGVKWMTESGDVVYPYNSLMNLAGAVVAASSTGSMKSAQQLEAAFYYLANTVSYVRSSEVPSDDWVKDYAVNTMSTKSGNCYGYAASFAYIAKGLGYDAKVCTGTVRSSLGGRTAHAWTEVKVGGKWYVFDAEMQNAKGSGYYKQTYDSYPAGPLEKEKEYTVSF
ncbi:MAG: hypothetical protein K6F75_14030 [Butyrivibrio sp.]|nr:hypothetical protein [Butyrivibrio sp.]